MGSEPTRTDGSETQSGQTSNVVRIPRDWFGPKDELVPFGPRAREEAATENPDPAAGDPPSVERFDANSFWGEDAGSVHDVVEAPVEEETGARRRLLPLLAAAMVVVIAGTGIIVAFLGASQPHPLRSTATALAHGADTALSPRGVMRPVVRTATRHPRLSPRTKPKQPSTATNSTTQVVSYEAQAPTSVSYSPPRSSSTSATYPTPRAGPAMAASASATTQGSQPAFGSSGALGPMSSPDG